MTSLTSKNKKVLAFIIFLIIVVSAFTGYLFWNQNAKDIVSMTNFQKLEPGTSPSPGIVVNWPFRVTVENEGNRDVSDLTVRVIMYGNEQKLGETFVQLGTLKAHSERTLDLVIWLDYVIFDETVTCQAILERDGQQIGEMNIA